MFRDRFAISAVLTIPILYLSEHFQEWFGYKALSFPGDSLVVPVTASLLFVYAGGVFLRGSMRELRDRARDDDPDLAGDRRRLWVQPGGHRRPGRRALPLGAGDAARCHAARPLDRDAIDRDCIAPSTTSPRWSRRWRTG